MSSCQYFTLGGDRMFIAYRLIRHVWRELTANPNLEYKAIVTSYGIKSSTQVWAAVNILRERGKIALCHGRTKPRIVLEPYHDDNEFAEASCSSLASTTL